MASLMACLMALPCGLPYDFPYGFPYGFPYHVCLWLTVLHKILRLRDEGLPDRILMDPRNNVALRSPIEIQSAATDAHP